MQIACRISGCQMNDRALPLHYRAPTPGTGHWLWNIQWPGYRLPEPYDARRRDIDYRTFMALKTKHRSSAAAVYNPSGVSHSGRRKVQQPLGSLIDQIEHSRCHCLNTTWQCLSVVIASNHSVSLKRLITEWLEKQLRNGLFFFLRSLLFLSSGAYILEF